MVPEAKAATPTVSVSRVYYLDQANASFLVDIMVTDATEMFGWVMNLSWNPNIIRISTGDPQGLSRGGIRYNIFQGDLMRNASTTTFQVNSVDNTKGTIKALVCFFATTGFTVSGSGLLARINFTLTDVGTTAVNITGPSSISPTQCALLDRNGQEIAHAEIEGLVTDQPPPPPPPFWTEQWFQGIIIIVVVLIVVPASLIAIIIVRLKRTPILTEEDLEKYGEFDEQIEGTPLSEDSE